MDHRDGEATALSNLGAALGRQGESEESLRHLEQALAIFRSTGHRYGEASVPNGIGETLRAMGRDGEAAAAPPGAGHRRRDRRRGRARTCRRRARRPRPRLSTVMGRRRARKLRPRLSTVMGRRRSAFPGLRWATGVVRV
ncbi:tetratricopeptide repeat protein [Nonomuraea fuscirosea]|uniref:tetratricopeptide repeat protein n=1 Tax=Nonomuraea fuscirosea TaxID=1291556 RepID=UPI003443E000